MMKPLPRLCYIGDVLVGVVSACDCPLPVYPEADGLVCVPDRPHESHDIVPVRGEEELPEGVEMDDYRRWCRLFAAAPAMAEALEALLALPGISSFAADRDSTAVRRAAMVLAEALGFEP